MGNKEQLDALVERFLARIPGAKRPNHVELSLDQFKREYDAHRGKGFAWSSSPGIYYFVDEKGLVAFVGKPADSPEHVGGLAEEMYARLASLTNGFPERAAKWTPLLREPGAAVGAYAFAPSDWYWPFALEHFLICELDPHPYLCEPPAPRLRLEALPSAEKAGERQIEPNEATAGALREELASRIQGTVVVMGIGNPCRGDDAAGGLVARQIHDVPGVYAIDAQDVPENHWRQAVNQRPDTIILVDSVNLCSPPGSVAVLDKDQITGYWPSAHRMPVGVLMNYFERETHARVFMVGIQPRQTGFMQSISAEVQASIAAVAEMLNRVLGTRKTSLAAHSKGMPA
ncbi:MAG TPA: hydrogenase maturation protease [Terriglobia bacterium]|nr:hydrogenase maturation protease [Terriglobia bacterium]